MPEAWSRAEVEATVAAYFSMLNDELRGTPFVKAQRIRDLMPLLPSRSKGSIEFKFGNISAVLSDLGLPFVDGFKPYSNYQQLLADVVADWVKPGSGVLRLIHSQVVAPAPAGDNLAQVATILSAQVDPPERSSRPDAYPRRVAQLAKLPVDYLQIEAQNRSLGAAGEHFVLAFERARLLLEGREALADRVEHVAVSQGDSLGFDVKSYEVDGTDRLIEVKTTRYGKRTPFFVSRNEVGVSQQHDTRYHLYRVFEFHKDPRLFAIAGRIDRTCQLDPVTFMARAS